MHRWQPTSGHRTSGFDTYKWLDTNEIEIGNTQVLTISEVGDIF